MNVLISVMLDKQNSVTQVKIHHFIQYVCCGDMRDFAWPLCLTFSVMVLLPCFFYITSLYPLYTVQP